MFESPLYTSRRQFLSGSLTVLSAAATLPLFLGRTARALAGPDPLKPHGRDDHPILVVVQLAGGNDGLNTVVPYVQDAYYQARPRIAVARNEVLPLKAGVGLHPAATGLKALFDDGRLAIVQGVGYPNPNRSHFTSMDIWHTADPNLRQHEGWLGRYFDACCKGSDPEPIQGVALMQAAPLALRGAEFMPLAFERPEALAWQAGRRDREAAAVFRELNGAAEASPTDEHQSLAADDSASPEAAAPPSDARAPRPDADPPLAQYLQRAALQAQLGADQIQAAAGRKLRRARRRGGGALAQQLELVYRMITAGLPTRVYYVSLGGFDTHSGQAGRHRQLLQQLGDALQDFVEDLAEDKLLDRVLIMTFSEFGRRVQENASGGTDHGEAAPMLLLGGDRLMPGLHGDPPDLARLHRGDLAFSTDFRRVYAAILRDWFGANANDILGARTGPLRLLRRP